jgi:DNA-binding NarL/FixJ family response regulator
MQSRLSRRGPASLIALPVTCPVFIGRYDEIEVLNDARRALARSRGSFVLIGAEAGVGKSRLVSHFVARTGDRRLRNLAVVECREGIVEPLRPIVTVVETLLRASVPDDLPASAQRALGRIAPAFASAYGREAAAGPVDRADFHAGLAALLVAFAEKRATILIVEDIHWADRSTLDFLAFLAPLVENTRLLVVATHRTEGLDEHRSLLDALTRIEREPTVRRIVLDPFAGSELREFVGAALGDRTTIEGAALEALIMRSEGNAFFAEELLKDALTRGRRPGARLPTSIRGTIVARLRSLDDAERRVLAHAAVIGLRFDPTLLAAVLESDVEDILPALQHARDAALLVEDGEETTLLRFRHALTREVIYDDILAFDRRRLHTRILETLERDDNDTIERRLFVLAEHAAEARDASRTLLYGERAGNVAWALGAFPEAIICFERALEAATDDDDRARLMQLLAFPVSFGGDSLRAVRLWEDSASLRGARDEHQEVARIHQMILCERFNVGDIPDQGEFALRYVEENSDHITAHTRDSVFVLVANLRSELCLVDGIDTIFGKIEDVDALLPSTKQSLFRANLNRAAYFGRVGDWRSALEGLIALSPLHENPSVDAINVADYIGTVVTSGSYLSAVREVETALARGKSILDRWGFQDYVGYYDALEAMWLFRRGRISDAASRIRNVLEGRRHLSHALVARTAPFLALAADDDALVEASIDPHVIERERATLASNPSSNHSRLVLGGYAVWLERRGRTTEATEYFAEALHDVPYPSPSFTPLLTFALRHFGTERIPEIERFADAERLAPDDAVGRATAVLASAARARRSGDADAAAAGFREAAVAYVALDLPLDAAHALYLAGDLDEARALYLRCGATAYVRERPTSDIARSPAKGGLSERERSVAEFVVLGLTNVEIADRMSVSPKTVEKHLASIFRKLGLRSRWQIAARLEEQEAHPLSAARSTPEPIAVETYAPVP